MLEKKGKVPLGYTDTEETPIYKPEGWEPLVSVMDGFGADLPDTLIVTRQFLEDLGGPIKATLREYVNLLRSVEKFKQENPLLIALVELIQDGKTENIARFVQAPGDDFDLLRDVQRRGLLSSKHLGIL